MLGWHGVSQEGRTCEGIGWASRGGVQAFQRRVVRDLGGGRGEDMVVGVWDHHIRGDIDLLPPKRHLRQGGWGQG